MSDSIKVTENVVLQNSQKDWDSQTGRSKLMLIGGILIGKKRMKSAQYGLPIQET